ncbi:hypothetical protein DPX16_23528 [Anabarilius grahami]|uniref:Transposase Tc1-like domain-containing protein n=1 Tax=Anabarilius grahami TaxID=495550 RepID=A0A3N0Z0G6_ANAGA|nr:hypothetical protein DPX16_23528 [Anabarilius grahami]
MGKRKDLSEFDEGQIVMARRLGQSISKTAALVGCSLSAVIDARGERRLGRVVRSNRRATVAQIAQEVNAGSDWMVSEYTVHRSLLRMGLNSHRPVRVPILTLSTDERANSEHQNWTDALD